MMIRKATPQDLRSICMSLYNKKIDYISPASAREDVALGRLYLLTENDVILGQCALKFQDRFGPAYYAIQRMTLYNKKNQGHHLADQFITYFQSLELGKLGVTPWHDNERMKHILTKHGFTFRYSIDENFEYWTFGG